MEGAWFPHRAPQDPGAAMHGTVKGVRNKVFEGEDIEI